MSISVRNSHFGMWTQLEPPSIEQPFWHELDDGSRHHLHAVLVGMEPQQTAEIHRLHACAIAAIAAEACSAWQQRETRRARALASAAARLAGEIVGLWPANDA
jgi:hypothetical protein